ncbi:MAG: NUDIX domain-containing protein [Candidatus Micrarchaeia archaeon]
MIKTKSAGGIVISPAGLVLVVNQKGTSWSLPKGHIDPGEDELAAAKREIYEESGIKPASLEFQGVLGTYSRYKIGKDGGEDRGELKEITILLFRTSQGELKPIDPENPEARWVEKEKVAGLLTHPKDKEFYLSALKKIR